MKQNALSNLAYFYDACPDKFIFPFPEDDVSESWELFATMLPDLYDSLEKNNRKQDRSTFKRILDRLMDEEAKLDKCESRILITKKIVENF